MKHSRSYESAKKLLSEKEREIKTDLKDRSLKLWKSSRLYILGYGIIFCIFLVVLKKYLPNGKRKKSLNSATRHENPLLFVVIEKSIGIIANLILNRLSKRNQS